MKKIIGQAKLFLIPFTIWIILGLIVLFYIEKGDLVLWFNEHRTSFTNGYFILASKFAEYEFILFFIIVLLNKNAGNAFIVALTWAATGIFAQSFKRLFDMPRPAAFFDEKILNFIGDGKFHYAHSFPSGHTTTAFAIFFVLSLFTENKIWKLFFFVMALSTAISRVYLLQHFFIDVYFGSILGIIIAYLVFVSINSSNIFGFQTWRYKKFGLKRLF